MFFVSPLSPQLTSYICPIVCISNRFTFLTIFTVGMQYFEPLQSYTKPEGPHPLDIQKLSPVYTWMVCLISFFMLIAGNGMVEVYQEISEKSASGLTTRDLYYEKQKVSNGLGTVTLLIIATKLLDKVYYRERLLPDPFFSWLNRFYTDAEEQQKEHISRNSTQDMRASIVSATSDAAFHNRSSFRVVAKVIFNSFNHTNTLCCLHKR